MQNISKILYAKHTKTRECHRTIRPILVAPCCMELHEMYAVEDLDTCLLIGAEMHFLAENENQTFCGAPVESDEYMVKQRAFRTPLSIACAASNRMDLLEKYGNDPRETDFCQYCLDAVPKTEPNWIPVLEHRFVGKQANVHWAMGSAYGVCVVRFPKEYIIGWLTVTTKPRQYEYTTGGVGRRGRSTTWGQDTPGTMKKSWLPSRSYDMPFMVAEKFNAKALHSDLMLEKARKEREEFTLRTTVDFHDSQDIYFLCYHDQYGKLVFSQYHSFHPPSEGVNVKSLTIREAERIFNFDLAKPELVLAEGDEEE